jgi:hypothetical protein
MPGSYGTCDPNTCLHLIYSNACKTSWTINIALWGGKCETKWQVNVAGSADLDHLLRHTPGDVVLVDNVYSISRSISRSRRSITGSMGKRRERYDRCGSSGLVLKCGLLADVPVAAVLNAATVPHFMARGPVCDSGCEWWWRS